MLYGIPRVHFFSFFFRRDLVRAISLELSLVETPDSVCCLVLQSNFALLLIIQFASLFIFFFFSAKILSGPYLWNRYSQRLQIECAAWSCGLILHYCLPSNSLCYFFFPARFCHNFVRAKCLEPLLAETPNWVCCLVLLSNCALLLTIQFDWLFIYYFWFFCHDFVRAIFLEPLLAETPNWVCCLVLWSNCALLLTIQFASLVFFFFNFFLFFCLDFVRAISLEPLLAETPNWVCCLVLRSNFALLLTIQFASLISSLINIISLLLTTLEFFIFGGSLLGRIQGDREPVSLLSAVYLFIYTQWFKINLFISWFLYTVI